MHARIMMQAPERKTLYFTNVGALPASQVSATHTTPNATPHTMTLRPHAHVAGSMVYCVLLAVAAALGSR